MASPDTIEIGGLLAGSRQRFSLDRQVKLEPFEGISFPEPAQVRLEMHGTGEMLEISGAVDVTLQAECYRCLREVRREMHLEVDEHLETGPKAQADPFGESNVLVGDRLDVGDLTAQLVCSAVPLGLLCSDECRGICPACGENKNTGACRCAPGNANGESKWRT